MARILLTWVLVLVAGAAAAERASLFAAAQAPAAAALVVAPDAHLFAERDGRGPLVPRSAQPAAPSAAPGTVARRAPSLFSGTAGKSFFAPYPERPRNAGAPRTTLAAYQGVPVLQGGSPVAQLLSLIALAEAGSAGYDAVQYGARIRPQRPPTRMTLGEIYAWIDATPRQPHAIGRYQFIPPTLRRVARIKGFGPETPFTPAVQDQLAMVLLEDAGLSAFQAGQMERRTFMRNLARIWAGLPLPSGKSYYEGHAGNSATMSWTRFDSGMATIWPTRG